MKTRIPMGTVAGTLLLGLLVADAPQAAADTTDNARQIITNRNVFRLNPPPSPDAQPQAPKPPKPKITLTGITTVLATKRALMTVAGGPSKPGDPPNAQRSCILAEGERDGGIEVLEINEKANTVSIRYDDDPLTLTFDAVKPNSPGPGPGPAAMAANNASPNVGPQIPRAMARRFPPNALQHAAPMPAASTTPPNPESPKAETALPVAQPSGQPAPPLTGEQQALLQEVERELHKNDPAAAPGAGL